MKFVSTFLLILLAIQIEGQVKDIPGTLFTTVFSPLTKWFHRKQPDVPVKPGDNSFWPEAKVPYVIDSSFDTADRAQLDLAITDYHNKTCIRWAPRSSESAYVNFVKNVSQPSAHSDNCYSGSEQTVTIGIPGDTAAMIHEMGHTLCFGHEQARNDRDEYLKPRDCSEKKYEHLNGGHLYDYRSIMHYPCDDKCLLPLMKGVNRCDSSNGLLSVLDAEKLNDMNKCGGCFSYRFRFLNQIQSNSKSNPVVAGNESNGDPLYICRAYHIGDIIPGKGKINGGECWLPYGGAEFKYTTNFEILTNPQNAGLQWVKGGNIPTNAIPGGRTRDGESLYIGRCSVQVTGDTSIIIPGEIHSEYPNRMSYSYKGSERTCTTFEILTCA